MSKIYWMPDIEELIVGPGLSSVIECNHEGETKQLLISTYQQCKKCGEEQ